MRIDSGEEIVATLTAFAERHGVRAGADLRLGAVGETELGFFVRVDLELRSPHVHRRARDRRRSPATSASWTGSPFPHCHVVIAGDDFVAHTGHLFRGIVTVTCEVQVITDPGVLRARAPPSWASTRWT